MGRGRVKSGSVQKSFYLPQLGVSSHCYGIRLFLPVEAKPTSGPRRDGALVRASASGSARSADIGRLGSAGAPVISLTGFLGSVFREDFPCHTGITTRPGMSWKGPTRAKVVGILKPSVRSASRQSSPTIPWMLGAVGPALLARRSAIARSFRSSTYGARPTRRAIKLRAGDAPPGKSYEIRCSGCGARSGPRQDPVDIVRFGHASGPAATLGQFPECSGRQEPRRGREAHLLSGRQPLSSGDGPSFPS